VNINNWDGAMKIKLSELIGTDCRSLDDGGKLFQALHPTFKQGGSAELDFSGVQSILTPFLHASIGKLLDHYGKEAVMERLSLSYIATDLLALVNNYIDRKDAENTDSVHRAMMEDMFGEDELADSSL
jgi:hypothetical protein